MLTATTSLTFELSSAKTPLSKLIKAATPSLTGGRKATAFSNMPKTFELRAPRQSDASTGSIIGTAFDYYIRLSLPNFSLEESVAGKSILLLLSLKDHEDSTGKYPFKPYALVAYDTFVEISREISKGNKQLFPRISLALAELDSFSRMGPFALELSLGDKLIKSKSGKNFLFQCENDTLKDLENLCFNQKTQSKIDSMVLLLKSGRDYKGNPVFGRGLLGADGDWIIGNTLYELKTVNKLDHSKLSTYVRQATAYALLDTDDLYKIKRVEIVLPRFYLYLKFDLEEILNGENGGLSYWRQEMDRLLKSYYSVRNLQSKEDG